MTATSGGARRRVLALALLLAALGWLGAPSDAEAQVIDVGQWRVGAGLGLFALTLDTGGNPSPGATGDDIALEFGLTKLSTCLTLGYQFSKAVLFGARLSTYYARELYSATDQDRFNLLLAPYFHYMFLAGVLRPFVGAEVGGGLVTKTRVDDRQGIVLVGLLAGLHYFLSYTAAISPWLELAYERRTNIDRNLLRVALFVTVSIWFGGPSGFRGETSAPTLPSMRF